MSNQEIIDKHLKEFHETHGLKVPIELNSYLHKIINECINWQDGFFCHDEAISIAEESFDTPKCKIQCGKCKED